MENSRTDWSWVFRYRIKWQRTFAFYEKKRIKKGFLLGPIDSTNDALNGLGGFCRLLFFVSPLPGHEWVLQTRSNLPAPGHCFPPCWGEGWEQVLLWTCVPDSHGLLHVVHAPQFDQPPSTERFKLNQLRDFKFIRCKEMIRGQNTKHFTYQVISKDHFGEKEENPFHFFLLIFRAV